MTVPPGAHEFAEQALAALGELLPPSSDARGALVEAVASDAEGLEPEHARSLVEATVRAIAFELEQTPPGRRDSLGRARGAMAWLSPLTVEAGRLALESMASGSCLAAAGRRADEIAGAVAERLAALAREDPLAAAVVEEPFEAVRASCAATRTCGERLGPHEVLGSLRRGPPAGGPAR